MPIRKRIVERLAAIAADYISLSPIDALGQRLLLTEELKPDITPDAMTFSGGVSEYIYNRESREFGDIGKMLADELLIQLRARTPVPILDPGQGIRATVIGASQFTVQVSGKTIYLPDPNVLPARNIPVVPIALDLALDDGHRAIVDEIRSALRRLDLGPERRMAVAFSWTGDPDYSRLKLVASGIIRAIAPGGTRTEPLFIVVDGDIARTLGYILSEELHLSGPLIAIDGIHLEELDFIDVGALISPPGVVPVIVKSLAFS